MSVVITQVFLLIAFAAVGYALTKGKILNSGHSKMLSALCLYLFLPSKVFTTFATNFNVDYLSARWPLLLAAGIIIGVVALLVLPIARLLTKDSYKRIVYHYSMTITNYGYVGYALAEAIFGDGVLQDVMTFAFTVTHWTGRCRTQVIKQSLWQGILYKICFATARQTITKQQSILFHFLPQ